MGKYNLDDTDSVSKLLDDLKENSLLVELLNGKRIRSLSTNIVFFILYGRRCMIRGEKVYNDVFADWEDIIELPEEKIMNIPAGVDLATGSMVFRRDTEDENTSWFLMYDGRKCHIMSMETVQYCHFKSPQRIPHAAVDAIPNGPNIDYK